MLLLTATTHKLRMITSAAKNVDVSCSYMDMTTTAITPGSNDLKTTTATTTDIVAAPAASTQRQIKSIMIRSRSADNDNTITVLKDISGTEYHFGAVTLKLNEVLQYVDGVGWSVFDSSGALKTKVLAPNGAWLGTTVIVNGTTAFTANLLTTSAFVRGQAGGGGGGGGTSVAAQASCAGGGSAGGYFEKTVALIGGTTYTVAVGAGGTAGANTGGTGGTGGVTTLAVGATTYTANGGLGGVGQTANTTEVGVAGGAPPAVSTNGDVNGSGAPGSNGWRRSGTVGWSGNGGSSPFGAGGLGKLAAGAGADAVGRGGGGAGGLVLNGSAAVIGGVGGAGVLIIDEFA